MASDFVLNSILDLVSCYHNSKIRFLICKASEHPRKTLLFDLLAHLSNVITSLPAV